MELGPFSQSYRNNVKPFKYSGVIVWMGNAAFPARSKTNQFSNTSLFQDSLSSEPIELTRNW